MQTFMPYNSFIESVRCLDQRRKNKQRIEAYQILLILEKIKDNNVYKINKNGNKVKIGWLNHPAVRMWEGYNEALKEYINCCIDVWLELGYKTKMEKYHISNVIYPKWLGNEQFHASHRSNLLRKNKEYYSKYNWKESNNLLYVWPI